MIGQQSSGLEFHSQYWPFIGFLALGFKQPFQFSERQKSYDYSGTVFLTLALYEFYMDAISSLWKTII